MAFVRNSPSSLLVLKPSNYINKRLQQLSFIKFIKLGLKYSHKFELEKGDKA